MSKLSPLQKPLSKPAKFVQPKLMVNTVGDKYEQEADEVAEKVMQRSSSDQKSAANKSALSHRIQRKTESGLGGTPAGPHLSNSLASAKGGGLPLHNNTRQFMERAFSYDFSQVRVHTGHNSAAMNKELHAKAFTHEHDIFFNNGQYAPESPEGKKLLAHELTHVVQQDGTEGVTPMVRRKEELPADLIPTESFGNEKGEKIDPKAKRLLLKQIKVAAELAKFVELHDFRTFKKEKRPEDQRKIWLESPLDNKVTEKIKEKGSRSIVKDDKTGKEYYYFKLKTSKNRNRYVIGELDEVATSIKLPNWNKTGDFVNYDVDHMVEWQVGGAHDMTNFWLWESKANQTAGSSLNRHINKTVEKIVEQATAKKENWKNPNPEKHVKEIAQYIRKEYNITVESFAPGLEDIKGFPKFYFTKLDVFTEGLPLENLQGMTPAQINQIKPNKDELAILLKSGTIKKLKTNAKEPVKEFVKGLTINSIEYIEDAEPGKPIAYLQCELFRQLKTKNVIKEYTLKLPVVKLPKPEFFGKLPSSLTQYATTEPTITYFSPIQVGEAFVDEATDSLVMGGKILPSLDLLKDLPIDIRFEGESANIGVEFNFGDLNGRLPKFIKLTNGSVRIALNTNLNIELACDLGFEIEKLGKGSINANKKADGFSLLGSFEFEKGLFDESSISLGYTKTPEKESGDFTFSGYALKKAGKNNKIFKEARVEVGYEKGIFTAKGEAETLLPGVSRGSIEVITGKGESSVKADFDINDSIPGVSGGHLMFQFKKNDKGDWAIEAEANILTKFPGIPKVNLYGTYDSEGIFLFKGDAVLSKGKFNGLVHFGITNQAINEKGELTGKKGDKLIAFGDGEVNFQMTDWLQGKIGAKITPDARVELSGALKPDPNLPITKTEHGIHKKVPGFSLPKFTIFGIPKVAEIFVTASGQFYLDAGIGPLYLRNAILAFDHLDIEAPEKTNVTGSGQLDIPGYAEAGIILSLTAGAGILIVEALVQLDGSLGVRISGNAGVKAGFKWNYNEGFAFTEAEAYLKANTELVARLGGKFEVNLDLLLATINLYRRKFDVGEKKWPLGLDLDLHFPLLFSKGDTGQFTLPDEKSIKYKEPEIGKDLVTKGAMEDPPEVTPAPAKEEVIKRLRWLPADKTQDSNWLTNKYERYNYAKNLKNKHPQLDWSYTDEEIKILDWRDFINFRQAYLNISDKPSSPMFINIMVAGVDDFEEKHINVNHAALNELRDTVKSWEAN